MKITKEKILTLVAEYISQKHNERTWTPGKDWVKYSGPYFDYKEYVEAISTLLDEWLVLGENAIKFEKKFPPLLGKKYGVVTNSGSSANLLMMAAMKSKNLYKFPSLLHPIDKGKTTKVLTPCANFPTSISPIIQNGFTPIFVDIELDTLNIDLYETEKLLEQHGDIKIITFAYVLGNCMDMNKLMELVTKYNLILIEDTCDALGSLFDNKPLGSFGELSSCSFYPAHHITGGEGGFVACNNKEQDKILRSLRDWSRDCYCVGEKANLSMKGTCGCRFSNWIPSLPNEIFDHKYVYSELGYNLKPIELQCSILLEQLKKLPEIIIKRKENYKLLFNIFSKYEEYFILPKVHPKTNINPFAFPLTIKNNAPFRRNHFTCFLEDHKIQTRMMFGGNMLLQSAYQDIGYTKEYALSFKNSTKITTDCFFLGCSPTITTIQISYIEEIIEKFFKAL